MQSLKELILETLQFTQNLDEQERARLLAQKISARYAPQDLARESKNQSKSGALNVVLLRFVRALFSPNMRQKYDYLFKIGSLHTLQGQEELYEAWLHAYNAHIHTDILHTLSMLAMSALKSEILCNRGGEGGVHANERTELLDRLAQDPSNVVELGGAITQAIAQDSKREKEACEQIAKYIGEALFEAVSTQLGIKANTESKKKSSDFVFEMLHKDLLKSLQATTQAYCEKIIALFSSSQNLNAPQNPRDLHTLKDLQNPQNLGAKTSLQKDSKPSQEFSPVGCAYKADFFTKDFGAAWEQTLRVFEESEGVLCVIRVFNHRQIARSFGTEGYDRQVRMLKQMFLRHFESMRKNRDVFMPKDGVLYLLLEGDLSAIERAFDDFCHKLSEQVFSYKEHHEILEFDGRLFTRSSDFLQTLTNLLAYIKEV
ncbi:hypothetical protein [uncultured Helicobacter sp.]|uniref:hypothetical protein n=1 Tax=uncultured Helicobacter sp. TaxID=175537 RepID=UPI003750E835